jgi:hypothetical protein
LLWIGRSGLRDEVLLLILAGRGKLAQTVGVDVLDALTDGPVGGTGERYGRLRRMSAHGDGGKCEYSN